MPSAKDKLFGSDSSSVEEEPEDPKAMAAEDMIAAVKSGDASAVSKAFQRMYDACAAKPMMSEESEEY